MTPCLGSFLWERSRPSTWSWLKKTLAIDEAGGVRKIDDISLQQPFGQWVMNFMIKIISKDFSEWLNPEQSRVKRCPRPLWKPHQGHSSGYWIGQDTSSSNRWRKSVKSRGFLDWKRNFLLQNFSIVLILITDRDISNARKSDRELRVGLEIA